MSDKANLIDTIAKTDMFSTFARLMRTSKADELITGSGPFTVFVPTNDAFGKVPDSLMNGWLSETEQTMLRKVLSYHIIPTKLFAASFGSTPNATTLSGQDILLKDVSGLRVNQSGVQARNMEATNGMIHALDTVLTPPVAALGATATAAKLS
ncbi:MAG TPA: fasciclin domain-containing protein [Pyrinomonadaceae bacterium]|jgi:uncharacterized surface protein with fasciclin (FAS1) repeats|nr:fasciclin domain-containing protein [Pyrinomonadaceae bacterium]